MNLAFIGYEELSGSFLDLLNSSYPTQPHSLTANSTSTPYTFMQHKYSLNFNSNYFIQLKYSFNLNSNYFHSTRKCPFNFNSNYFLSTKNIHLLLQLNLFSFNKKNIHSTFVFKVPTHS